MNNFFVITDLEATCCEDDLISREESEIIEIGAVICDKDMKEVSRFQTFVRPVNFPELTPFCTKLTHIRQLDVDSAPLFKEAIVDFASWIQNCTAGNFTFGAWGNYDANQIARECLRNNIENKITHGSTINIKESFSKWRYGNKRRRVGFGKALELINITFEGTPHRALHDALNTATLFEQVKKTKGLYEKRGEKA
jgi:inhibitor of KinA sporulation pathway (predicted exonuclease)